MEISNKVVKSWVWKVFLVLVLLVIGGGIYFSKDFAQKNDEFYLHYISSTGNENFTKNIKEIVEEKIGILDDKLENALVIENVKQGVSFAISFCEAKDGVNFYSLDYKISGQDSYFESEFCYDKQNALIIFNEFCKNNISYRTDLKWNEKAPNTNSHN